MLWAGRKGHPKTGGRRLRKPPIQANGAGEPKLTERQRRARQSGDGEPACDIARIYNFSQSTIFGSRDKERRSAIDVCLHVGTLRRPFLYQRTSAMLSITRRTAKGGGG